MGMEIPAPKEEEEENDQSGRTASFLNVSTEGEQDRVIKEDEEEEGEDDDEEEEEEEGDDNDEDEEKEEEEEDGELVEAAEESEHHGGRRQEEMERTTDEARELRALKARPSVLVVGPPGVGKRSLVSRLIARGRSTKVTSETGAIGHGWTVNTKYYTANVSVWTAPLDHPSLEDTASVNAEFGRCEALVMVFDCSNPTSFEQLKQWATGMDLDNFEIRLCIGNKADRVPEHFAHTEYRRKLQRKGESTSDPHPEFWDFGINRTEGSNLLDNEGESAEDRRRSCIEWCSDNCFEYIEACAVDEVFDECMTVDDDLQGVARIDGALTAHMWPGLVMKDGNDVAQSNQEQDITSDDDSDYYIEYELLSNGSAEPWEASGWEEQWSFSPHVDESTPESSNGLDSSSITDAQPHVQSDNRKQDDNTVTTAVSQASEESVADSAPIPQTQTRSDEIPSDEHVDLLVGVQNGSGEKEGLSFDKPIPKGQKIEEWEDMEQLMSEMANMRTSMRAMSDQHRRETAAQLALRMASMFKDDESGESDFE